jgi:opacity protein-like surface antigen
MNISRRFLIAAAALAAFAAPSFAADANVTGKWTMQVETQAGAGSPTFDLKQEGDKVTGQYAGALGQAPVTGTVKGNEVTLSYTVSGQGQEITVTYTGTVEGDTMKGKVSLGEMGEGTFTGKKG